MVANVERILLQHDVERWLSAPDPWTNHNAARKIRQNGTATWFTQLETYNDWKKKPTGSVLWIHGIPGSGKTVLCSTIIEDIWFMRQTESVNLAFFYFDHQDATKLYPRSFLSSLLVQLSNQSDRFCEVLSTLYMSHDRGSRQPGEDELMQCLRDMINQGESPVYIILDALDECPDSSGLAYPRAEVLEIIQGLIGISPRVYLCIASRPEMDIRRILDPLTTYTVSLDKQDGRHQSIAEYIMVVVHSDSRMREWPEVDKKLVIDTLTQDCGGMFRWASCKLNTLRYTPLQSIRRVLRELPKTLDETYERILRTINEKEREYAYRIFQCLVVSARPLRVEELAEIFAIEVDAESTVIPKFNAHWRPMDAEAAVLFVCSSLVTVVELDGERTVQFSHPSVQQFLTSDRIAHSKEVSNFKVLMEPAHTFLARVCLSLLLDERNETGTIHDSSLHSYAAQYWVDHARFGNVSWIIREGMERLFDRDRPHFAAWIRAYNHNLDRPQGSPQTPLTVAVPLYYAALCGFYDLSTHLLATHPQDVNARGGLRVTPLHAAIYKGHEKVAQLLLQNGADLSARDSHDRTPLHLAAECGDPAVLRFLIDHGANLNAENKDQETPLFLASRKERLEAARVLCECRADINHQGSFGRTPLHVAAKYDHLDIARLLLDFGADINAPQEDLLTPLHLSADHNKLGVTQLLLERGAEVDSRDKTDQTPLHKASEHGNPEVLRALINHGADMNAENKNQETPLFSASRNGRLEAVRVLCECRVDMNHQDSLGRIPLHVAAKYGLLDVAHLLLDCGADINAQEKNHRTPLHVAVERGKHTIARLLLERGAEVDAHDKMGWSPLHFASRHGHLRLVRLLLERDADVLARNNEDRTFLDVAWASGHKEIVDVKARYEDGLTALHIASQHGDPELMRWLIDHDVSPSAVDEDQETPLFPASRSGKLEATRLLLDAGADPNHRDWQGMTPLHVASEYGHDAVTKLLLDRNADVNARHVYDWTPLHLASRTGKGKVAKLLLDGHAEVNARNDSDWTPLHMASQKGHPNVSKVLLDRHADVNIQEEDGETALHLAAFYGHRVVAQVLIEKGADQQIVNMQGKTPFDLARIHHHDIAPLLEPTLVRERSEERQQISVPILEHHHYVQEISSIPVYRHHEVSVPTPGYPHHIQETSSIPVYRHHEVSVPTPGYRHHEVSVPTLGYRHHEVSVPTPGYRHHIQDISVPTPEYRHQIQETSVSPPEVPGPHHRIREIHVPPPEPHYHPPQIVESPYEGFHFSPLTPLSVAPEVIESASTWEHPHGIVQPLEPTSPVREGGEEIAEEQQFVEREYAM